MLFKEAIEQLNKGNYVTRNGWEDGRYLAFLPGMAYVWQVAVVPNPAAGNWLPTMQDLVSDDWEVHAKIIETVNADAPADAA